MSFEPQRLKPELMALWRQDPTLLDANLDASIIIPTYNRSGSLTETLESIAKLEHPIERFEVIVVDNNSTDRTPQVVQEFSTRMPNLTYIKETRLSFTAARHSGASQARSNIFAYIDDDVIVGPGWLSQIVKSFADLSVGIVAGRIDPLFTIQPPDWALAAQSVFNGWSLWAPSDEICDTIGACGPSLTVRADVLELVGGFPPDTMGVESSGKESTVEKIYVGPGDWGLNEAVTKAGFKILYNPEAKVQHVIPEVRMRKDWWRSRLEGEGYMHALTHQVWEGNGRWGAARRSAGSLFRCTKALIKALIRPARFRDAYLFELAGNWKRFRVELVLIRSPNLAEKLWKLAITGVQPSNADEILRSLP